jgi:hypothetical protein
MVKAVKGATERGGKEGAREGGRKMETIFKKIIY